MTWHNLAQLSPFWQKTEAVRKATTVLMSGFIIIVRNAIGLQTDGIN